MKILVVANIKGGTGKTTTAAWAAHAATESGLDTFVADADPQGSITKWAAAGGWELPVAGLAVPNLHTRLAGVAGPRDLVVVDTPPLEDHRAIVTSALRAATHVLIPVAPTAIEYVELHKIATVVEDVTPLRDRPPATGVLMARVRSGTASHRAHREQISADGWHVLTAHVGMLERFAQSFASPITAATETGYGEALAELLTLEVAA